MSWIGASFLVVAFLVLAHLTRIPARAVEVVHLGRGALGDLRNPELDDLAKEKAMRATSVRMLGLFVVLTLLSAVALGVPVGLLAAASAAGWCDLDAILDVTVSWPFLLGATVVGIAGWMLLSRVLKGRSS